MINLALRSEYTFKKTYGHIKDIVSMSDKAVGIADINNTFSHSILEQECKKAGIKPIFGVRLEVVKDSKRIVNGKRVRGLSGPTYIFIAKSNYGLQELNILVKRAYENFYYKPMLDLDEVLSLSDNVFVIAENFETPERVDYIALTNTTSRLMLDWDIPKLAINCNNYISVEDKDIYQLLAGGQKRGDEFIRSFETQTYPQHILSEKEWRRIWKDESAIWNTYSIIKECNVEIPKADMVRYNGSHDIEKLCRVGAIKNKIDIKSDGPYKERYEYEIGLIRKKDYVDYFMIVADMITKAKRKCFVGPSRGSSAGSLVCYLMGITEIDPLKHGLIFERFIDLNRDDLPDIDVDFPDNARDAVIKQLFKDHGEENVSHISNVNTLGARSAIGEFADALGVPKYETDLVKESIVDRSGGDARAKLAVADTLETTEVGKEFIKKYPAMNLVKKVEGHARHAGKHAAGIIVCSDDLTKFCGINAKENSLMVDKKGAEYLNLLKIDVLGLKTLSILEDCAKLIGMNPLSYYKLPLDDQDTFKLLTDMRLSGIFQFEGRAMMMLCSAMGIKKFDDIVALTALARPGPLHSGGANTFIKRRTGEEETVYICNHEKFIEQTKDTYGIIVYQEQLMNLCRECGLMSWEDVSEIRKAASKTYGKEFFDQYKNKFLDGAKRNGIIDSEANTMWESMMTFGCLSGDTIIKLPGTNQYSPAELTLKELYDNGGYAKPTESSSNDAAQIKRGFSKLWMYDFEKEACFPTRHLGVVQSGEKVTWLVKTKFNKIRATKEHKFLTKDGWKKLIDVEVGDEICLIGNSISNQRRDRDVKHNDSTESWRFNKRKPYDGRSTEFEINRDKLIKENEGKCVDCGVNWEETHHIDGNRENNLKSNLAILCRKCHKQRHKDMGDVMPYPYMNGKEIKFHKVESIDDSRTEMTYDIMMPDPNNNFEANGFIVHNSWGMNLSHAVSYGYISYWCAYMKTHHPLEFSVSYLNHNTEAGAVIKFLRDITENDGLEYKPVDPDESTDKWTVHNNKLVGPLTNIEGIGVKKAKEIMKMRKGQGNFTPSLVKKLLYPVTDIDILYPCRHYFGDMYINPTEYNMKRKPDFIGDVEEKGEYIVIGRIFKKELRDLNEYNEVMKRKGKILEDDTLSLRLVIEDDTGQILSIIDRRNFDELEGQKLYETLVEGESWIIIKGEMTTSWRLLIVRNIFPLPLDFCEDSE